MGEYAKRVSDGAQIKIGTCEDQYYLRADQIHQVIAESGSVNPVSDGKAGVIRFRFPWPDEDQVQPGEFKNHDRSLALHGLEVPAELADEHYSVQFKANAGYLCSLPCPESGNVPESLKIHRNGFAGAVKLSGQKFVNGELVPILECGGCELKWRVEDPEEQGRIIDSLITEAKRAEWEDELAANRDDCEPNSDGGSFWRQIAARI